MANATGRKDADLPREQRIERACELYASGQLSREPATKLAGLDRAQFDEELFRRHIPTYTREMLEQDLAVVAEDPPQ